MFSHPSIEISGDLRLSPQAFGGKHFQAKLKIGQMPEDSTEPGSDGIVEVRCYFVRKRNALAVRADFGPIYMDHYLHLMQHGLTLPERHDSLVKDLLAAATLHLASQPWNEVSAWTLHFGGLERPANYFVTGNSREENIIARAFTEGVREDGKNLFISQVTDHPKPPRKSVVDCDPEESVFCSVEAFYARSEQRNARFFSHGPEDFVFISAQPQCDEAWLLGLNDSDVRELDQQEELSLLEVRRYRHHCGCTPERLLPALATIDTEELFGDQQEIRLDCPRCAAKFQFSREDLNP